MVPSVNGQAGVDAPDEVGGAVKVAVPSQPIRNRTRQFAADVVSEDAVGVVLLPNAAIEPLIADKEASAPTMWSNVPLAFVAPLVHEKVYEDGSEPVA